VNASASRSPSHSLPGPTWRSSTNPPPVSTSKGADGTLAELRKGHDEIRFRSDPNLDLAALATSIGMVASQVGPDEYVIDAPPHPKLMAQLTTWLAEQGHPLTDLRAGGQRLEDVFRDFLAPGVLALAVMSTSMVSLGIGTGFERSYHVLKRLATTPLGRPRLIAAKIASVAVVELVQFAVLVPVAFALGWSPSPANWALAVAGVLLGTAAFAGIGLTLAGRLRGEINLAAQNGLYLVLLLLGGMVIPFSKLPDGIRAVAHLPWAPAPMPR